MAHRADGLNDIFEHDVTIRDNLQTNTGQISTTPAKNLDIANKKYVDDNSGGLINKTYLLVGGHVLQNGGVSLTLGL